MALNWKFTDEVKFNQLTDEDKQRNDVFIWGAMVVGLGDITDKNAEEWAWRYKFAVDLNGAFFYEDGKPYIPSLEEVRKRIGLRTNNFPNKTRKQFVATQTRVREQVAK